MTRVLVTRPAGQEAELVARLAGFGIAGVAVPAVSVAPMDDGHLAALVGRLDHADWLVITSANGADAIAHALDGRPLPDGVRVAAVGPATAEALRRGAMHVDAMPGEYLTEAIADCLGPVEGRLVVLARADAATPRLRDALRARGARVEEVVTYRTLPGPPYARERLRLALEDGVAAVLFSSGSTVRGTLDLAAPLLRQRLTRLPAICIGPVTAEAARNGGFVVAAVASEHTAAGLARATADYVQQEAR